MSACQYVLPTALSLSCCAPLPLLNTEDSVRMQCQMLAATACAGAGRRRRAGPLPTAARVHDHTQKGVWRLRR